MLNTKILEVVLPEELVDPEALKLHGKDAIKLLDPGLLKAIAWIDSQLGRVTVNTYHVGGVLTSRGYRSAGNPVGASKSMHRVGRAIDFDVAGLPARDVRAWILDQKNEPELMGITRMEEGVNWVHIDSKPLRTNQKRIVLFRP